MNKETKEQFVRSLCDSVRDHVIGKIPKMPDSWDGHELRRYLADQFEREAWSMDGRNPYAQSRKRIRAYRNDVGTSEL